MTIDRFIDNLATVIVNPLIYLLFTLALVLFIYGVFKFVTNSDDQDERSKGGKHILWGAIGMFIMFSAFGIIRLILRTLDIPFD